MYQNNFPFKRYQITVDFIKKHIGKNEFILDLGVENPLSNILRDNGFKVDNTGGEDLDIDRTSIQQSKASVVTAFQIFEHLLNPFQVLKEIKSEITNTIKKLYATHDGIDSSIIEVNRTSDNSHGDLYTNVAMKLAKILKKNPLLIAEEISKNLQEAAEVWGVDITRTEITDILVDEQTKDSQRQQLNAERERRAAMRNAKIRLSNLKLEELTQTMRNKSKIIKC